MGEVYLKIKKFLDQEDFPFADTLELLLHFLDSLSSIMLGLAIS